MHSIIAGVYYESMCEWHCEIHIHYVRGIDKTVPIAWCQPRWQVREKKGLTLVLGWRQHAFRRRSVATSLPIKKKKNPTTRSLPRRFPYLDCFMIATVSRAMTYAPRLARYTYPYRANVYDVEIVSMRARDFAACKCLWPISRVRAHPKLQFDISQENQCTFHRAACIRMFVWIHYSREKQQLKVLRLVSDFLLEMQILREFYANVERRRTKVNDGYLARLRIR